MDSVIYQSSVSFSGIVFKSVFVVISFIKTLIWSELSFL